MLSVTIKLWCEESALGIKFPFSSFSYSKHFFYFYFFLTGHVEVSESKICELPAKEQEGKATPRRRLFRPWETDSPTQSPTKIPQMHPTQTTSQCYSSASPGEEFPMENVVATLHNHLLRDLHQGAANIPVYQHWQKEYLTGSLALEESRKRELSISPPWSLVAVNSHFDDQRLSLIQHFRNEISSLRVCLSECCHPEGGIWSCDSPQRSTSPRFNTSNSTSPLAYSTPPREAIPIEESPREHSKGKARRGPGLDRRAIEVLNGWYTSNEANPYPSAESIAQLAQDAQLTTAQVRKWFANTRLRSHNTYKKAGRKNPLCRHKEEL